MLRLSITIGLLLALLLLARVLAVSWQSAGSWEPPPEKEKARRIRTLPPRPARFYPQTPAVLPDLNKGYVFNAERSLSEEEQGEGDGEVVEVGVDIDKVTYSGSIITSGKRIAIIAYPAPRITPRRVAGRPVRIRRPIAGGPLDHKQVSEGDIFSGYTVAAILPEKIIFEKGAEKVEKLLFDEAKERVKINLPPAQPVSRVTPRTPPVPTERQAAGGVPGQPQNGAEKTAVQPSRRVIPRRVQPAAPPPVNAAPGP